MAGRNSNAKAANPNAPKLTPEEQASLNLKLDAAFKVYARRWRGFTDKKDRQRFLARVIHLDDNPSMQTDNFGETKMRSLVKVELVEKGMEAIRFQTLLTDNPKTNTVQNPNSALNHLVRAATGRSIPEAGNFNWDTDEVVGQLVWAEIERGNDRTDGQRGGLYSELKDFARYVPVDDDEDEAAEEIPIPASATRKRGASATSGTKAKTPPAAEPDYDAELDDVPF